MICILVVWLHLRACVSRSTANKVLKAIQFILSATLHLIELALFSAGFNVKFSDIDIPRDVRTTYRLHCIEPEIIRTACCPKCFSLIPRPIPWRCQWKASPRSQPCNTELWKVQNTQKGLKWVPRCLFSTQSFDSWLSFFLSRQVIEKALDETFRQQTNCPQAPFGADMCDIHDSPGWKDLFRFSQSPYRLIFGIYVDWFNPYTNKIAGM